MAIRTCTVSLLALAALIAADGSNPSDQDASDAAAAAAAVAGNAAKVASKVARHSGRIEAHAHMALDKARKALNWAHMDGKALDGDRHMMSDAEEARAERIRRLQGELESKKDSKSLSSLERMQEELGDIRQRLAAKCRRHEEALRERGIEESSDAGFKTCQDMEKELADLEAAMKTLQQNREKGIPPPPGSPSHDEMKADVERLRDAVESFELSVPAQSGGTGGRQMVAPAPEPERTPVVAETPQEEGTPVQEKGIDVDTEMPYGELEPFGREDTAQELTEQSVRESDEMVDQLERAEVAEEKRSVFRALTRLRGAAITSYDGIARAQTGNIDEYNKTHKWRKTHPLHHLADEESDISKWAFPDNADFL